MRNICKIVLGTVQFGCQYGINSAGRPNEEEVRRILAYSAEAGITKLDTSSAYGDAEKVLGKCMPNGAQFQIISKYPETELSVRDMFMVSLRDLRVEKLYGYLLHLFSIYKANKSIWHDFQALKQEGLVEKIGFSIYTPDELEMLIQDQVEFDILQVPRSILDRKFDAYLPMLKERGVEVHVRSTFLQGLFFKERNALPEKLQPLKPYLQQMDEYAQMHQMSISEVAMNYNLQNENIDGVLIGVDSLAQLQTNLQMVSDRVVDLDIDVQEKELVNPVNWN